MKYAVSFIAICLLSLKVSAQNQYLQLVDSAGHKSDEYYDVVFPLLYKNFSDSSIARFVVIPSFSKECSFSVERKNGVCVIILNYLNKSYWYAENKKSVRVRKKTIRIDDEMYNMILRLFKLVEEQTRYYQLPIEEVKVDGTMYYFSASWKKGTPKRGTTHSPDKNTLMDRLTAICWKLYQSGIGKQKEPGNIRENIKDLISDLSK